MNATSADSAHGSNFAALGWPTTSGGKTVQARFARKTPEKKTTKNSPGSSGAPPVLLDHARPQNHSGVGCHLWACHGRRRNDN